MKALIGLFFTVFMAGGVLADPYSAAMRQANSVSAKVTAADSQQVPDNPPPARPQPAAPASPALQATLQNIQSLHNDLEAISKTTDTNALTTVKAVLINDLTAAAQGTKPVPLSVSKLADDLTTAMAGNEKLRAQQTKLAQYFHAVFNSSYLTVAQQQMIFNDVQKILAASGPTPDNATNVVKDIESIAAQTR